MGVYYPIFRGRQFELIALRELVEKNLLSNSIVPIIEPVKISATYLKTVDAFIEKGHKVAIVNNPQVGELSGRRISDISGPAEQLDDVSVISCFYVTSVLSSDILSVEKDVSDLILICNQRDNIEYYADAVGSERPIANLIPDNGDFRRRIRANRIICEDHFPKKNKNSDYLDTLDEFFSSDHLYYEDDGYKGFSDYSIIGSDYSESGFAPYAVAIHIVYFDDKKELRIRHFVSDTNSDIRDPANKYSEAARKLVEWNNEKKIDTYGLKQFRNTYVHGIYQGLGVVKKYSIMHHMELMSMFLDGKL